MKLEKLYIIKDVKNLFGIIKEGYFIREPVTINDLGINIQEFFAMSIVSIKLEDENWYHVFLQRKNDDWIIWNNNIMKIRNGFKPIIISCTNLETEELLNKILNYNRFRLPLLLM